MNPTTPTFFLECDFLRKREKSVANSWECEIGWETKSWDLASLTLSKISGGADWGWAGGGGVNWGGLGQDPIK